MALDNDVTVAGSAYGLGLATLRLQDLGVAFSDGVGGPRMRRIEGSWRTSWSCRGARPHARASEGPVYLGSTLWVGIQAW